MTSHSEMVQWITVFLVVFALDVTWPFYLRAANAGKIMGASLWAVGLFIASAVMTIGYTKDPWMIIPGALGAFAGTCVAVWWGKR